MVKDWYAALDEIPDLGPQDVVEITREITTDYKEDTQTKEVESVEEDPEEGWQKKVHFLDGSYIRKSTDGKWGWVSINRTVHPLRRLNITQKNS